jgi:ubiquinol-cytochrome c reductase cytochrome b subunit
MANVITRTANTVMDWVNARTPGMMPAYRKHMTEYYAPKNFNLWYFFGSLALLVLVNQILTGIFLTMHFKPSAAEAFSSVEYIMRDVEWGWLIRYMHSTGASLFFIVVYLHMFRGLMYGSYKKPRELVWLIGMVLYLVLMAEAFMGYVLPWGQMSFWGAKVIISLFGAIPVIGNGLTEWIMGDYLPGDATLNRFFALHVIALPLVILLLVVLHIGALHEVGSNNPDGVEIKKGPKGNRWSTTAPADGIPFHPYYTVQGHLRHRLLPDPGGLHHLLRADLRWLVPRARQLHRGQPPGDARAHQAGVVLHAVLRDVARRPLVLRDQAVGRLVMFAAIAVLFLVPWLDKSPVKSYRYRGKVLVGDAADVRRVLRVARQDRRRPGYRPGRDDHRPRADLPLLRVLHHHAALDQDRPDQAGARTSACRHD